MREMVADGDHHEANLSRDRRKQEMMKWMRERGTQNVMDVD